MMGEAHFGGRGSGGLSSYGGTLFISVDKLTARVNLIAHSHYVHVANTSLCLLWIHLHEASRVKVRVRVNLTFNPNPNLT